MSEKRVRICDTCKKEVEFANTNISPPTWFFLRSIHIDYYNKEGRNNQENELTFYDGSNDPDFCSEKCCLEWFRKKIQGINTDKKKNR